MRSKNRRNNSPKGKNQFTPRQREVESEDMKKYPNEVKSEQRRNCDAYASKPNDWRWYAQNEQLVTDVASFQYATALGTVLRTGIPSIDSVTVPGVMSLEFVPSIGFASIETDPINVAMRRLYAFVRHANSGSKNYEAPDLMLYTMCVDSAHMFLSYMKRIYGVMLDYTPKNRYYPKALIRAMNVNFSSIESNLNDFRGYINQFAVKLSQLWIPNSFSMLARHSWMCEGMYTDSSSSKPQTYIYVPTAFYFFATELSEGNVGGARLVPIFRNGDNGTTSTFEDLINYGNSMLENMIVNEDFGVMGGDILKAFGEAGIIKPMGIAENYQILPEYNQEVLSQIENSTAVGTVSNADITQKTALGTGSLVSMPKATINFGSGYTNIATAAGVAIRQAITGNIMLNFHHDSPAAPEAMVATRLANILSNVVVEVAEGGNLVATGNVATAATEIVETYKIYYYKISNVAELVSIPFTSVMIEILGTMATSAFPITGRPMLSAFDWHPAVIEIIVTTEGGTVSAATVSSLPLKDYDVFATITEANLSKMAEVALLSELTIPQLS